MKIQINKLLFLLFIISGLLTFSVMSAYGDDYKFEVGIPGIVGAGKSLKTISLQEFTSKLIKILFPIAGILAFAMIVFAGFEYATSGGDTNKQKDAQDRITNALIGLLLLFAFGIIIYTINPDILKTKVPTLEPVTLPSVSTPFTPGGAQLDQFIATAKSFAFTDDTPITSYDEIKKNPGKYSNLENYLQALQTYLKINPETDPTHGASCDMYVASVIRATIDPQYPSTWAPNQYNYLASNPNFTCFNFNSLSQLSAGDILFSPEHDYHTALKLDNGYYQASNMDYYPYGPTSSWYTSGIACRYIHFSGGGTGGSAG